MCPVILWKLDICVWEWSPVWRVINSTFTCITYFNALSNPSLVIKLKLRFSNGRAKTWKQVFLLWIQCSFNCPQLIQKQKQTNKKHKTTPQTKTKQAEWNVDLSYFVVIVETRWDPLILYLSVSLIPPMTGSLWWHLLLGTALETWKSSPGGSESWEIGLFLGTGERGRMEHRGSFRNPEGGWDFFFFCTHLAPDEGQMLVSSSFLSISPSLDEKTWALKLNQSGFKF